MMPFTSSTVCACTFIAHKASSILHNNRCLIILFIILQILFEELQNALLSLLGTTMRHIPELGFELVAGTL